MGDIVIKTEKLTKRFGDFVALDDVSLEIPAGQRYDFDLAKANAILDQAIHVDGLVFALGLPCAHRGVYSAAYGTYTPTEDLSVINALLPPRN